MNKLKPAFLHGILQRSGTNFLNAAILNHPNCVEPKIKVRENYYVDHSDPLWEYADRLFRKWSNPKWGGEPLKRERFFDLIGKALIEYLSQGCVKDGKTTLITKTPSVSHLERTLELFPGATTMVMVRDPRDVAASAFRTWGIPVMKTMVLWQEAAMHIARFERVVHPGEYRLVRYEDMVRDPKTIIRQLLAHLALDESLYDWSSLSNIPVLGSSDYQDWKPKARSDSFKSSGKWETLPQLEQDAFASVSETLLAYFGYPLDPSGELEVLPTLECRLGKTVRLQPAPIPPKSFREKFAHGRRGTRMIAEALLGEKAVVYLRSRIGA